MGTYTSTGADAGAGCVYTVRRGRGNQSSVQGQRPRCSVQRRRLSMQGGIDAGRGCWCRTRGFKRGVTAWTKKNHPDSLLGRVMGMVASVLARARSWLFESYSRGCRRDRRNSLSRLHKNRSRSVAVTVRDNWRLDRAQIGRDNLDESCNRKGRGCVSNAPTPPFFSDHNPM
jgi:hypothetical protein